MTINDLTWPCHACGKEREDAEISVATATFIVAGIRCIITQRYCNDSRPCAEQAVRQAFDLAHRGSKLDET